MNYQKHYDALIARAFKRDLSGYSERHHIIPRCLGGSDSVDNMAVLTASEHFVAHQLLAKIYPLDKGVLWSVVIMSGGKMAGRQNNKLFSWVRERAKDMLRGVPRSQETKDRLGASHKSSAKAKRARELLFARKIGVPRSDETKAKIGAIFAGVPLREDHRKSISAALTGKIVSPDHAAHLSASLKGNQNALGAVRSPETRAKMSAAKIGVKMSADAVRKMVENKTPEQRRAGALKAWETKRAKAALLVA